MAKITLKEIAKLADVSVMTVSNVIHGKNAKVSIKTKEKILKLVEKYQLLRLLQKYLFANIQSKNNLILHL